VLQALICHESDYSLKQFGLDMLKVARLTMNPDNPLARHSGEGRNPARKILREADNTAMLSRFRGELLTIWIPAFAGITQFFLMDYLG